MKEPERDYNGDIIRYCSDCEWCKSLEGSDGEIYYTNRRMLKKRAKRFMDSFTREKIPAAFTSEEERRQYVLPEIEKERIEAGR